VRALDRRLDIVSSRARCSRPVVGRHRRGLRSDAYTRQWQCILIAPGKLLHLLEHFGGYPCCSPSLRLVPCSLDCIHLPTSAQPISDGSPSFLQQSELCWRQSPSWWRVVSRHKTTQTFRWAPWTMVGLGVAVVASLRLAFGANWPFSAVGLTLFAFLGSLIALGAVLAAARVLRPPRENQL